MLWPASWCPSDEKGQASAAYLIATYTSSNSSAAAHHRPGDASQRPGEHTRLSCPHSHHPFQVWIKAVMYYRRKVWNSQSSPCVPGCVPVQTERTEPSNMVVHVIPPPPPRGWMSSCSLDLNLRRVPQSHFELSSDHSPARQPGSPSCDRTDKGQVFGQPRALNLPTTFCDAGEWRINPRSCRTLLTAASTGSR